MQAAGSLNHLSEREPTSERLYNKMANGNEMIVTGNVAGDPELRFTPSGAAVANFGLAWNRRFKDKNDEWDSEANFIDVTCWAELAENVASSLRKGDRVTVVGRFNQDRWEDRDSGKTRTQIKLIADEVGASMRWAEVAIRKNERDDNGGGRSGGGRQGGQSRQGGGGRQQSQSRRGGGSPAPAEQYDGPPDWDAEEPFVADAGEWMAGVFGSYPERMLP